MLTKLLTFFFLCPGNQLTFAVLAHCPNLPCFKFSSLFSCFLKWGSHGDLHFQAGLNPWRSALKPRTSHSYLCKQFRRTAQKGVGDKETRGEKCSLWYLCCFGEQSGMFGFASLCVIGPPARKSGLPLHAHSTESRLRKKLESLQACHIYSQFVSLNEYQDWCQQLVSPENCEGLRVLLRSSEEGCPVFYASFSIWSRTER